MSNGRIVSPLTDGTGYLVEFIGESRELSYDELYPGWLEEAADDTEESVLLGQGDAGSEDGTSDDSSDDGHPFPVLPADIDPAAIPAWIDAHAHEIFPPDQNGDLGDPDVRRMRIEVLKHQLPKNPGASIEQLAKHGIDGTEWIGRGLCDMASKALGRSSEFHYRHRTTNNSWNHYARLDGRSIVDGTWKQFFTGEDTTAHPPVFRGDADAFRRLGLDGVATESYLDIFGLGEGERPVDIGRAAGDRRRKKDKIDAAVADWLGFDEEEDDDRDEFLARHLRTPEDQQAVQAWNRVETDLRHKLADSMFDKAFKGVDVVAGADGVLRLIAFSAEAADRIEDYRALTEGLLAAGNEGFARIAVSVRQAD